MGSVWGGCGLSLASLSMQDSDGDKSDDLVVDVSNEVRAVPSRRAALCVGSWRWFLAQEGAVVSRLLHHYRQPQPGLRPLDGRHQAGQEEEDQGLAAWWLGSRSHHWVPRMRLQRERERERERPLKIPVEGRLPWSSRSALFSPPSLGSWGGEPHGSASAGNEELEGIYTKSRGPASQHAVLNSC